MPTTGTCTTLTSVMLQLDILLCSRNLQLLLGSLLTTLILINYSTLYYLYNNSPSNPEPDMKVSLLSAVVTPDPEQSKMPRIVHLSWRNYDIPRDTVKWVKRWSETNPNWEVWFWTDRAANNFIAKKYPKIHRIFGKYSKPILKSDAMRYLLLYEFGGVWADLDVEPRRSLDSIRDQYSCIVSQESLVHARSGRGFEWMACNAIMLCQKKHPFFKFVIEMLETNQKLGDHDPVAATGPVMLTRMFLAYKPLYERLAGDIERYKLHLAPINMFLPTVDIAALNALRVKCEKHRLRAEDKFLCEIHLSKEYHNGPDNTSFTDHHWWHSYLHKLKKDQTDTPISEVITDVVFPDILGKF